MPQAIIDAHDSQFLIADLKGKKLRVGFDAIPLVEWSTDTASWIAVITGAQWGDVSVETKFLGEAPRDAPADEWDDVIEFGVFTEAGLCIQDLEGDSTLALADDRGAYRLRISARGRDLGSAKFEGSGEPSEVVVEHYLIEAWLDGASNPLILRGSGLVDRRPVSTSAGPSDFAVEAAGLTNGLRIARWLESLTEPIATSCAGRVVASRPLRIGQEAAFHLSWTAGGFPDTGIGNVTGYRQGGSAEVDGARGSPMSSDGLVRLNYLSVHKPMTSRIGWNWLLRIPGETAPEHWHWQALKEDSIVEFSVLPLDEASPS